VLFAVLGLAGFAGFVLSLAVLSWAVLAALLLPALAGLLGSLSGLSHTLTGASYLFMLTTLALILVASLALLVLTPALFGRIALWLPGLTLILLATLVLFV